MRANSWGNQEFEQRGTPYIMNGNRIVVSQGSVFAISDTTGDINEGTEEGFYANDTRFLSKFRVRLETRPLDPLGYNLLNHSVASFYTTNPQVNGLPAATTSILRDRYIKDGFHEDIHVVNHSPQPQQLNLEIILDSDFADIFQVRLGNVQKTGKVSFQPVNGQEFLFSYQRGSFKRETWINFSAKPKFQDKAAIFQFTLSPKQEWKTCVTVLPITGTNGTSVMPCVKDFVGPSFETNIVPNGHDMVNNIIGIDETSLKRVYTQALADLQMLRVKHSSGHDILAAGLPWFMALFGRDSIISAIQTRSLDPTLMVNTLQVLAEFQAKDIDAFHEAQPGKILHEVRMGELSVLNEMPHSCYYGSVDATPLFLRLLWEAYEASHDLQLVQQMLPIAENALEWIDKYGDMDGDGFVEYDPAPSNRHGLKNQGWKDSNDSISYMDGRLAEGPIALVEVQGYVYDAKRRMAELYRILGNSQRALKLTQEAEKLRNHFEEAYWMPDHNFYAVALDGNKRQVDTITSNPGHCLWSNIVSPNRVSMVVERLMAPDMFSGWGVRTLSTEMVRYNPLSYHNGSIWPHDNSIIAVGMKSYGFNIEAKKIAMGIFDAALSFPKYRPPELFAGYPRRENSVPIAYPAANAPQAWASGAIIYLTDNVLGMRN